MKSKVLITVVVGVLLAACEHQPPVQETSNGQFSLTATSSSGYHGSRELAAQKANTYCGRSGQRATTTGLNDKAELGPNGEHSTTITFTCAAPVSHM